MTCIACGLLDAAQGSIQSSAIVLHARRVQCTVQKLLNLMHIAADWLHCASVNGHTCMQLDMHAIVLHMTCWWLVALCVVSAMPVPGGDIHRKLMVMSLLLELTPS
jgi:hypothetical protein